MTYKMYLLDIHDLEDKSLSEEAMTLIDDKRREIANKYCKEKDRLRAIAAGLLLQVGFLELEQNERDAKELIAELKVRAEKDPNVFPTKLIYQKSEYGKPYWDKQALEAELAESVWSSKKLWHFNLSHSGEYVVLIVADTEVGVDVQEERNVKHYPGGYKEFSRMEAYVKCTGEGFSRGHKIYEEYRGKVPGYEFFELELLEEYVLWLCFRKD